jgi:hypothetical protein
MTGGEEQTEPGEAPSISADPDILAKELKHGARGGEAL